jgi:hypothetical protein
MRKNVVSALAEDDLGSPRRATLVLLKEIGGKANDGPASQDRSWDIRTINLKAQKKALASHLAGRVAWNESQRPGDFMTHLLLVALHHPDEFLKAVVFL